MFEIVQQFFIFNVIFPIANDPLANMKRQIWIFMQALLSNIESENVSLSSRFFAEKYYRLYLALLIRSRSSQFIKKHRFFDIFCLFYIPICKQHLLSCKNFLSHGKIQMLIKFLVVLSVFAQQGSTLVPEAEFCQWFFKQCPDLKSKFRPSQKAGQRIDVSLVFGARRLAKVDDVEQRFVNHFFSF